MKLTHKLVLKAFFAIAAVMAPLAVSAQTGINSPYSRYGLGTLSDQSVGMGRAMGGVGVGMRRSNTINTLNPASYSSVDTLTFIADFGFSMQNGNFQESDVKVNARNASVDYMAMQYRILPKVGMTVGFMPFSNVGYSYSNTSLIRRDEDGEVTSTGTYVGNGGTRQFMAGLGYRPTKWLSAGVGASYLFGNIDYSSTNTFSQTSISSSSVKYAAEISALRLDFGLQGTVKIDKDATFVIGATYTPGTEFKGDVTRTNLTASTEEDPVALAAGAFSIPNMMAAGVSYSNEKLIVAADASYQNWSKAKFWGKDDGADCMRIAAGFSYCPELSSKSFFKHNTYRGGLYMKQPYFNVNGRKGPTEYGISAGFTMPVSFSYNSMSHLHFTAQYVRVQPGESGMITENYLRLSIGVTFLERWFAKWMVE